MKIDSMSGNGFNHVYTHNEPLPQQYAKPSKKPYLILVLPMNNTCEDYLTFFELGFSEVVGTDIVLTITSHRKVRLAINTLLNNDDYFGYRQTFTSQLAQPKLVALSFELARRTKTQPLPPLAQASENYSDAKISKISEVKPSSHKSKTVQNDSTKDEEILKINATGRRIGDIEAFNGICYRALLNERTPIVRSVYDKRKNRIGVISRVIPNFQSMNHYYERKKAECGGYRPPPQEDLIKAGIGKVLAASYLMEENDLHGGNIYYDPVNLVAGKIDHDQATWSITAKYFGLSPDQPQVAMGRGRGVAPRDAFPITQRDITNFPHLTDAKPHNFPDKLNNSLMGLKGIENDPRFIKDAFSIFLMNALFDEQVYRPIVNHTIANPKLQQQLVENKANRARTLRTQLLQNKKFLQFFLTTPAALLKKEIISEFKKYNQDYEENSPLRLDISSLEKKYEAFSEEIFSPFNKLYTDYYKPEMDYQLYKSESPQQRKKVCIYKIKYLHGFGEKDAAEIFQNAQENWENDPNNSKDEVKERAAMATIETIYKDVLALNGKVGRCGGKTRITSTGARIKIATGASLIFDQCVRALFIPGDSNKSAITALDEIIAQARKSDAYKGHSFFNQRQPETSALYKNIINAKPPERVQSLNWTI